jgi:hypothetical protein
VAVLAVGAALLALLLVRQRRGRAEDQGFE